jgi:putative hemolysin
VRQVLTLELSEEAYRALQQQAEIAGISVSEWITTSLEQQYGLQKKQQAEAEKEAARQRFRHHAGAIDLGYATGADNESIDADLVRAYGNQQEK